MSRLASTSLLLAFGSLFFASVTPAAFAASMTEPEIREKIVGRTIFLAAPMGGEFPLNYRTSGVVDGDGKALGIGKLIQPSDTGKWWIADNKLCQQFSTWYKGAKMCFDLTLVGDDKVKWVRDDGETGVARIGN
ncbi:hypothetical protein ASG25_05000 [Rhizobium sp. Leaf384]|uniref:hypothetical protein n=1 Tax=unclassified Rhizobium TaxID=2613769 RepID=UPI000712C16D|nr:MULTISPECIES: hypothetical protein [unclassified Rhizobium]KQR77669.1 hypothetical protein ASG03_14835 [Rhizobium sp. Leaf341]KQS80885.1 hypothetical protein ASG25_05000 [Rhizobium sp. Leaf384]KQS86745.1 hypothetical protein ASG58_00300 [Rhizobium sp. Leaf383]